MHLQAITPSQNIRATCSRVLLAKPHPIGDREICGVLDAAFGVAAVGTTTAAAGPLATHADTQTAVLAAAVAKLHQQGRAVVFRLDQGNGLLAQRHLNSIPGHHDALHAGVPKRRVVNGGRQANVQVP